jgi:hypothetical protein
MITQLAGSHIPVKKEKITHIFNTTILDKYSVLLSGWLKAETTKPRKWRRNLKQLYLDLKEPGYEELERVNSAGKRTLLCWDFPSRWHFGGVCPYDLRHDYLFRYRRQRHQMRRRDG